VITLRNNILAAGAFVVAELALAVIVGKVLARKGTEKLVQRADEEWAEIVQIRCIP
jgi:hypothetical protein